MSEKNIKNPNRRHLKSLYSTINRRKKKANEVTSAYTDFSKAKAAEASSPFGEYLIDYANENIANDLGLTAADMQDFKG